MQVVAERWGSLDVRLRRRLVAAVLVAGMGFILVTAMWLTPAPAGHSTHLQLGLSECSIMTVTGYPCPMCGATTTFTLWAHLRPIQGVINQPFASLLFLMTAGTFAVSLVELFDPRGRWRRIGEVVGPYDLVLSILFLIFMAASWLYKVWLMGLLGGAAGSFGI